MKKSLVAVLLSLVALTMVAGAAFAEGEFTITAEGGDPAAFTVEALASNDVEAEPADWKYSDPEISVTAESKVKFALESDDVDFAEGLTLTVYQDGEQMTGGTTVTNSGSYVLAVESGDVIFAFKAEVTISGSEEEKGNPTTVDKASDAALTAAKAKFPDGTKMFDASVFESALTSKDYAAIKDDLDKLALYTAPANIDSDGAIIFKIKLTGIDKGMLLKWVSILLDSIVTGDAVTISAATEIPVVYYFDDATGNEIMLNDVTTADNQEVDVAFAVTAGRQVFGVSADEAPTSGGSPSSGCDMGLLGSLALFAVALLPLRKSK